MKILIDRDASTRTMEIKMTRETRDQSAQEETALNLSYSEGNDLLRALGESIYGPGLWQTPNERNQERYKMDRLKYEREQEVASLEPEGDELAATKRHLEDLRVLLKLGAENKKPMKYISHNGGDGY